MAFPKDLKFTVEDLQRPIDITETSEYKTIKEHIWTYYYYGNKQCRLSYPKLSARQRSAFSQVEAEGFDVTIEEDTPLKGQTLIFIRW